MSQPARGSASLERVRAGLAALGLGDVPIREFAHSTATAADAAAAIGTRVECIVKSLVFMAGEQPILVLASGPNRVDTAKVGDLVGNKITRANADQVRQFTGYAIGGVSPIALPDAVPTLVDRTLLSYPEVWAAAGTPYAVFPIDPHQLVQITSGRVEDVVQAP